MTLGEIQTTRLDAVDRLTASLTALMQAHLPRHASVAVAGSGGGRQQRRPAVSLATSCHASNNYLKH